MSFIPPSRRPVALALLGLLLLACIAYAGPLFFGQTYAIRDHLLQTLPSRAFLGESLRAGHFPQWWDGVRLGERFASDPNHGVTYPPAWIVGGVDPLWGADAILILHVLWAGMGTLLFARRLGASPLGAFFAGGVFMLSGYTTSMVVNGTIALPLAWLPFMAWASLGIARAREERGRLTHGLALALVMAAQVLAGNPAFLNSLPVALLIVLLASDTRWRAFLTLCWAGALGALMGAVTLSLTLPTLRDSVRAAGIASQAGAIWSLHPARLLEWIWPFALGAGFRDEFSLARLFIAKGDGNYLLWSASLYLGFPALAAVFVALWRRPSHARWLGLAALLFVFVAMGSHTPIYPAYRLLYLPETFLRYPEKHVATAMLFLCALAGLGLDGIFARPLRARTILLACLPLALLAGAVGLIALNRQAAEAWLNHIIQNTGRGILPAETIAIILRGGAIAGLLAALLPLSLGLARMKRLSHFAAPLLVGTTLLSMVDHGIDLQVTLPREELRERPAIFTQLPSPEKGRPPRVAETGRGMTPMRMTAEDRARLVHETGTENIGARFGYQKLPGYLVVGTPRFDAFVNAGASSTMGRIMDLLGVDYLVTQATAAAAMGMPTRSAPVAEMVLLENRNQRPRAFVAYRHVIEPDDGRILHHLFDSKRANLDLGTIHLSQGIVGGQTADAPPTPCQWEKPWPEHVILRCHTEHPGHAVLLDEWTLGWTATVDGAPAPLLRADVLFRAVPIPAGDHVVEMRYRTPGLTVGLILSGLGWLAFAGLCAWAWRRRRRGEEMPLSLHA